MKKKRRLLQWKISGHSLLRRVEELRWWPSHGKPIPKFRYKVAVIGLRSPELLVIPSSGPSPHYERHSSLIHGSTCVAFHLLPPPHTLYMPCNYEAERYLTTAQVAVPIRNYAAEELGSF